MRRIVTHTALLITTALLAGCDFFSRKVDGEISIRTSPTENAKLVLVPVHLVSQQALVKVFTEVLPGFADERDFAIRRARTLHESRKPLDELSLALAASRAAVTKDETLGRHQPAALAEISAAESALTAKKDTLAVLYAAQDVRPLWDRVLQHLSAPVTKTDADGRFHFTVPDDGEWFVIAESVRASQRHRWCVPLAGTKRGTSTIGLSNENTVEEPQVEALLVKLAGLKTTERPIATDADGAIKEAMEWAAAQKQKLTASLDDLHNRALKEAALAKVRAESAKMTDSEEKRKADEVAMIEKQRAAAVLALEMQRNFVAQNRASAVGTKHERIVLKNNKVLDNVTVKNFNDDGVSFISDGGAARVLWSDLPDSWVGKFRDPPTAQIAAEKAAQEAAILADVEAAGHEVELSFVREVGSAKDDAALRGSVVKVLRSNHGGTWKEANGWQIFVLNMGKASFENSRIAKVRLYPTGRRSSPREGASLPLYVGTAAQALQLARESGLGLAEMSKDEL